MLISFQPKLKHALNVDPCRNCGRYLKTDRVQMHETACRMKIQKEIFDMPSKQNAKSGLKLSTNNDKRMELQNLMESIRQRGYIIDVSLPPPLIQSDYIRCFNCLRRFHSDAAYRHIPKCPDYEFSKLKPNTQVRKSTTRCRKVGRH